MEETMSFQAQCLSVNTTSKKSIVIGPGAIIGKDVVIGEGTKIGAHAMIAGRTIIGNNCIIHPHAAIAAGPFDSQHAKENLVIIGDNTQIREFVTINGSTEKGLKTQIGSHCLISAYSQIDSNCIIGDFVVLSNAVKLAAHAEVENRAVIGGLAIIHPFIKIGRSAMIGGISKIIHDVPPFILVNGNPAQAFGINLIGMRRAGISENKRRIIKKAYKILYLPGLSVASALEVMEEQLVLCEELKYFMDFLRSNNREICGKGKAYKSKLRSTQVN
ncbi:acyl-ACP--UDP-N-acetylglucosamine O-acyltransferase [Sporomusa sp.]|jgi:UDP-N-acetylglucosamine acyltransferase|uniref:acyl-ACP--UDP-N-acetylglucosamine O-acyltransferase n=1 Tax=Sporomusa sp. TaxID=2078658 RepID=UPI002973A468|nr:acyl-ACP--UDP-N-acetylglucosamine O-acyltransferase [Sporomusa sp.]MDF2570545.1 lpxA [Sporomusa sp.]HWR08037.1 acyl-ACP--UDP-N-acetylglucosamine O-acyltransferase [Sporomusa sp.]